MSFTVRRGMISRHSSGANCPLLSVVPRPASPANQAKLRAGFGHGFVDRPELRRRLRWKVKGTATNGLSASGRYGYTRATWRLKGPLIDRLRKSLEPFDCST